MDALFEFIEPVDGCGVCGRVYISIVGHTFVSVRRSHGVVDMSCFTLVCGIEMYTLLNIIEPIDGNHAIGRCSVVFCIGRYSLEFVVGHVENLALLIFICCIKVGTILCIIEPVDRHAECVT